ncbi:CdaR family transcriptional regulator [Amycolatopsis sp. FDAARGOS 1241]|uniref:PucR family transcriptional regulator n=1 Tax=Amycolatopsis sp. FDAARGOS 1241 TaxID=2778070 RepID=UPI0019520117|nr:helix-turn-helix domain-containing protein [Amycolatopsis sp. FDAARGOS 1241]QRP49439.1 helix-turn-helix domain-containing protein [Amycolatopsis sp. FDAARGOS 1241]
MGSGERQEGPQAAAAHVLATALLGRVDDLTDELVGTINDQNPGYRQLNVVPDDDLWKSCHDNLERVLQLVAECGDDAVRTAQFFDAARTTGQRRAQQRLPLDDLLRSFRIGGRLLWQAFIAEARAEHEADPDDLLDLATRIWELVDALSAQVAASYHAAEQTLVRADEQRRAALWEGLLQGRASDAAFAYEAARILRLPVEGAYAAVTAPGRLATSELTEELGRGLDDAGIRSAWQVRADVLVGLAALPVSDTGDLTKVLGAVRGPVGVSLVVDGLAEVHTAHRQAVLALRTVPHGHEAVVCLAERLPEAMLLSSPELTASLMQQWLRGLLELAGDERRVLLQTLATWVETGGSATRAGQLLHCHRNTVLNRMHRVEVLTGRRLDSGDIPLELALVVRALPFLPPRRTA